MSANRIVVAGASLAGGRAAETLRRSGYAGEIVMIGAEPHRPYDRPPLSKKFLRQLHPEEKLYFRALDYYEAQKIELELGRRVVSLDAHARSVTLDDGRSISFDTLMIATGADVRRLDCPGAELEGIHTLRSLDDSLAIRAQMKPGARVLIVGAGVIGAEVAASCREEGLEVVMFEAADTPLLRAFGPEVGKIYAEVHRDRGVDVRLGQSIASFVGEGRVKAAITSSGERIDCDFVVVGIGVTPATEWLEGSGVALERGVIVDENGRTNVPNIYAAGDVARFYDPRIRAHVTVESIDNAQNGATAAANNALEKATIYSPIPFFWSDQYDLKMQSVGYVGPYDRVVFRGSVPDRTFIAFHLRGGKLEYAIGINRMKEIGASKKLIASGAVVPPEVYADESANLASFVPAAPRV
jgi:3-phenylpropionate/trans-cinnamate dioxygenase ferredoxin reductase component